MSQPSPKVSESLVTKVSLAITKKSAILFDNIGETTIISVLLLFHAVQLVLIVELSTLVRENLSDQNLGSKVFKRVKINRKIGNNYMESNTAMRVLSILIDEIEAHMQNQTDVNKCYNKIIDLFNDEASSSTANKRCKHQHTKIKEYWDLELSKKWRQMKIAERDYRVSLCGNSKQKFSCESKHRIFKNKQREFDYALRKKTRKYVKGF